MSESKKITMTVAALAEHLNGSVSGDDSLIITGVNALAAADKNEVTFITAKTHVTKLIKSKAAAVIISRKVEYTNITQIVVPKVEKALIAALKLFAPQLTVQPGINPTAVIAPTAQIAENVSVGAGVHLAENVKIGSNTIIAPGCCIGENTSIGNNCRIDSNVVIYHNCKIGSNCIIQANSVIGSTGFGYYFIDGSHQLIPHNGGVIIEDCVDIGANTCIDRAKFGNTIIGAGTKIDNLVQIAHNVVIGKCCIVVAQVGIAGSVTLGNGVVFAAQSGVADNVTIGDGVVVGGRAGLISNAEPGKKFLGFPARERNEVLRLWAIQRNLPAMNKQLKELTRKVAELEAAKNDKN